MVFEETFMKNIFLFIIVIMAFVSCKKDAAKSSEINIAGGNYNKNMAEHRELSDFTAQDSEKEVYEEKIVETQEIKKTMMKPDEVTDVDKVDKSKPDLSGEKYQEYKENTYKDAKTEPLSTFSIDVDTASYTNMRRMITSGYKVIENSVRIEELINYFDYEYINPEKDAFSVTTEVGPSPFNKDRHILHIGIQGKMKTKDKIPSTNLIFLVDTSGSMFDANKLPLLKKALTVLTNQLREQDFVTIVTYAGSTGVLLEPTSGKDKEKIIKALESMQSGGSTYGEGGLKLAYKKAKEHFNKEGINRILLCTDGDFNVGVGDTESLKKYVEKEKESGVTLSTIGFGTGNYNDDLMEQIADIGNGNYSYIDNYNEAVKVLATELTSLLEVIAKDVKIQIEFNSEIVSHYKLIGYENRVLKKEDFNNDKVDAGEIGSGHSVTALYEIVFTDSKNKPVDELRYAKGGNDKVDYSKEFGLLKLRFKEPNGDKSTLVEFPMFKKDVKSEMKETSTNFKFSLAVAAFGMLLKNSKDLGNVSFDDVINLAKESKSNDEFGYREEFIQLVEKYKNIK